MAKWHYYDENDNKVGPVRGRELKGLAKAGLVTRNTVVETEEGVTIPAKWIQGLKFAETPSIDEESITFPVAGEVYDLVPLPPESSPPIGTNPFTPIEDTSAANSKAKWSYHKDGEKINVTSRQLKRLAKEGLITQDTIVEDTEGESAPAKFVKGLKFAEPAPIDEEGADFSFEESLYDLTPLLSESTLLPSAPPPQARTNPFASVEDISATDSKEKWYYYDATVQKQGPYDDGQLKLLARKGVITPETFLETPNGKSRPAKSVKGLVFAETLQQAIDLQKRRRIYVIVLGLILALLSYTGVWWFLLIGWLAWGAILALVLLPMMAMDSASKAVDMID